MPEVFEMQRRARKQLECDVCGETIEIRQRWYFERKKIGSFWEESNICEECAVFGPPHCSVFELWPYAPDDI